MRDFEKYKHVIKDYKFKRGDLVLVRNTAIKSNLDRKMYDRFLGPLVVIERSRGGAYVIAELDGSVFDRKVAAFRVVPYLARRHIDLPKNLGEFIDVSDEKLEELMNSEDPINEERDFSFSGIKLQKEANSEDELVYEDTEAVLDNEEFIAEESSEDETPVSSRLRKRKDKQN
jgi:hypothetical protein